MKNTLTVVVLILTSITAVLAQKKDTVWRATNLVVNFSFETPIDSTKPFLVVDSISKAIGWSTPNQSNPLIYSTDKKGYIYDPNGSLWDFKARTGKSVAGLDIYTDKRDYIQGSLISPLVVGKKYYFAFWVHYHCSGANNIGIAFLPNKIKIDSSTRIPLRPATYQKNMTPYSNSEKSTWTLVRDSFIAQKPFQSFIIGNFFTDAETTVQLGAYNHFFAYIDDVAVWEARVQPTTTPLEISQVERKAWEMNEAIVTAKNVAITLNEVYFSLNSADLDTRSYITLDSLVYKMKLVNTMKIQILGHTSSDGSTESNLKLSEKRALAVKNYLISKGIEANRLTSQGVGEKQPIVPNDTEENKNRNRRVEFVRLE